MVVAQREYDPICGGGQGYVAGVRLNFMMPSSIKTYARLISEFSKGHWLEIFRVTKICIINVGQIILNVEYSLVLSKRSKSMK